MRRFEHGHTVRKILTNHAAIRAAIKMIKCPLCESIAHETIYDFRKREKPHSIPGPVVQCSDCSLWFKIVDKSEIRDAYGEAYARDTEDEPYMTGDATRAYFRRVIRDVGIKQGRLLDIGTGLGAFVEEAQKAGYQAEGIDLCAGLVARAQERGLRVRHMSAEDLDTGGANGLFDVVTMMDLIEHVPEPLALLSNIRKLLKPDGELVVYTPNHRAAVVVVAKALGYIGSDFAVNEIFGGNHLTFFDDRTLAAILTKAGFSIREMKLSPYDPSRPGQPISRLSLAAVTAIEQLGRPFNRMFRMLAYARNAWN